MIRILDLIISIFGLIILSPILVIIYLCIWLGGGQPLFRQRRIGRYGNHFTLLKFRTMHIGSVSTSSHLATRADITAFGKFLRVAKIDELPQLWNVLVGDMSLVGPRPCLPQQIEIIDHRQALGVLSFRPGITGLAQIRGIDMSTPELLALTDREMMEKFSLSRYFVYILLTLFGKGCGDRVS